MFASYTADHQPIAYTVLGGQGILFKKQFEPVILGFYLDKIFKSLTC